MNRLRSFATALVLIALPCAAAEPINEICYSAEVATGVPPTNDTEFACPASGTGTITALAAQGLRIVKLAPVSTGGLTMRHQLIVARPVVILADGFEP